MTVVGIPLRPFKPSGAPPKLAINRAYIDALAAAGADVLPLPILPEVARLRFHFGLIDALVLPGGADIEPRRYGAEVCDECNVSVVPELDEAELTLARWAIDAGMPVLGICRGIQVLNVACGGSLWQDLNAEGATSRSHDNDQRDLLAHELTIEPDSMLARAAGTTHVRVNSMHHQAIRDLAPSLRCVAMSDDGLIEGVELRGHHFTVAVQCHPEELVKSEEWARSLFRAMVAAGAEYHAGAKAARR